MFQLEQAVFTDHGYPDFFFRQSFDCWPQGFLVAVNSQNEVIGYLIAATATQADTAWILSVAVANSARGQGVGRQLMNVCVSQLPSSMKYVYLTVSPENPAVHLYSSLGFDIVDTEEAYFGEGETRHLMRLVRHDE